jgi:hypothetical protein
MSQKLTHSKFLEIYMRNLGNKTFQNNAEALLRDLEVNGYVILNENES